MQSVFSGAPERPEMQNDYDDREQLIDILPQKYFHVFYPTL